MPFVTSVDGDGVDLLTELAAIVGSADLGARVAAIYAKTPRAVLTLEEVADMLGVSEGTCAEVMTALVRQRLLRCTCRGEYVLR